MKQPTYFCDHCNIEKFDSESQTYKSQSFSCKTSDHYHRHIDTKKHIINSIISKDLEADLVVECKYCSEVYTKEQYKEHSERNALLWAMKTNKNIYKYSVCNHFVYDDKRFNSIKIMKEYVEESSRYKKEQIKKNKVRAQIHKMMDNEELKDALLNERRLKNREKLKAEMDLKQAKKDAKEAKIKEEKQLKKLAIIKKNDKPKTIEEKWANEHENTDPNLKLEIIPILEEEHYEEEEEEDETPSQIRKRERADFDIPPIIDEDDMCRDCLYYENNIDYPIEKLERYNIRYCVCGEDTEDEDD